MKRRIFIRNTVGGISAALIAPVCLALPATVPVEPILPTPGESPDKKILIAVTSHADLGDTGRKTGYRPSEVSHPWKVFKDAGYSVDFVSPKGGDAPTEEGDDPKDAINKKFLSDIGAQRKIHGTMKPSQVDPNDYMAILFAGGHGALWDLPKNEELAKIAQTIYERGGVVGAIAQGAAGLLNIKLPDGKKLVEGKNVNGTTNEEEKALGIDKFLPILVEDELKKNGGIFEGSDMWQPHVVSSGRVVTGQNAVSSGDVARAILIALKS